MMLFRPAHRGDYDALALIAKNVGIGFTSIPDNPEILRARLDLAERSFTGRVPAKEANYLFALEDLSSGEVVGISGIEARVGLSSVWYNYRVSNTVNASRELNVHQQTPTLYLTNDMTNCSELCSLFLRENARKGANGHFLSRARMLFLGQFSDRFSEKIFAEMRGISDDDGNSPFWESLGGKFFGMAFPKADYLTGMGQKSFIAELMPKYPIYLPFLSPAAQDAVGKVHEKTRPALALLQSEGFNYNGLIDIFDGGPVVEAFINQLRVVREMEKRFVVVSRSDRFDQEVTDRNPLMVCNGSLEHFRAALVSPQQLRDDSLMLAEPVARALHVEAGDLVHLVRLRGTERPA